MPAAPSPTSSGSGAPTRVTVTAHPALVTPIGFTDDDLPVGIQLVGRPRGERDLRRQAAALEQALGLVDRHPPV